MLRKLLTIIILFISSIGLVFILNNPSQKKGKANGFKRIFTEDKIVEKGRVQLDNANYSIFKVSSDFVYLYEYKKPYNLFKISTKLLTKQRIQFPSLKNKDEFNGLNSVSFFQNNYVIISGRTSMGYKTSESGKVISVRKLDSIPFYQSVGIDSNSFVILSKIQLEGKNRRQLKKITLNGKEIKIYLPEKQSDGYFSNDGQFRYDSESNRLVYMYYYQGKFTSLDTNLNVIFHAKSIDTITHAGVRLVITNNKIIQSTPPKIINKRISVSDNKVFLYSKLKSDNEDQSAFDESNVIDVYSLSDGKYSLSFYLPKLGKENLREFGIYKGKIIVVYSSTLVIFEFKSS